MVYLGKSKMDKTKRISLIKEVADLFDMMDGDHVLFYASDGKIIISKATQEHNGFDIEGEIIEERIRRKERELEERDIERHFSDDEDEYEKMKREAIERYEWQMEERAKRKELERKLEEK